MDWDQINEIQESIPPILEAVPPIQVSISAALPEDDLNEVLQELERLQKENKELKLELSLIQIN
tara:strand:- start:133 stop:324 length:192 start_codon:yes stop_codon:yes gene_type:complete